MTQYVERMSRRLARIFSGRWCDSKPRSRRKQRLQNRTIESVGEDLLAMLATVLYADGQTRLEGRTTVWELAESFCACAKQRVTQRLAEFRHHGDYFTATTGTHALKGYISEFIVRHRAPSFGRLPSKETGLRLREQGSTDTKVRPTATGVRLRYPYRGPTWPPPPP